MKHALFLLLLLTGSSLAAATINVFDGIFADAQWSSSLLTNTNNAPGITFSAYHDNNGGVSNSAYRHNDHNTSPDGSGPYNSIRTTATHTRWRSFKLGIPI